MLGGERESQGEAKFRAPPLKYSKYSYVYLDAHVYSLLLHLFPRITSLSSSIVVTDLKTLPPAEGLRHSLSFSRTVFLLFIYLFFN